MERSIFKLFLLDVGRRFHMFDMNHTTSGQTMNGIGWLLNEWVSLWDATIPAVVADDAKILYAYVDEAMTLEELGRKNEMQIVEQHYRGYFLKLKNWVFEGLHVLGIADVPLFFEKHAGQSASEGLDETSIKHGSAT